MYPNLVNAKTTERLSNSDIGTVIGVSGETVAAKLRTGAFTVPECKALCRYFSKPFEILFATEDEIIQALVQQYGSRESVPALAAQPYTREKNNGRKRRAKGTSIQETCLEADG